MGCAHSVTPGNIECDIKVQKAIEDLRQCLDVFMLTDEDINILKKSFQKINITHDGSIEVAEIEIYLRTERCPFTERILSMYDSDKSGQLEFPEFLLMCWTYCTMDTSSLGNNMPFFLSICIYVN